MMRIFLMLLFVFPLALQASYLQFAQNSVAQTWKALDACGLRRVDAWDPKLPKPQVLADQAIVNRRWQILAYYVEGPNGYYGRFDFKNTDGGMVHSVNAAKFNLNYVTPYFGSVARANRVKSVGGYFDVFYCRSQRVPNALVFEECVRSYFVDTIADQLCRNS